MKNPYLVLDVPRIGKIKIKKYNCVTVLITQFTSKICFDKRNADATSIK